jgi:protein-cysteine N-palmitoyltransferase HHAT
MGNPERYAVFYSLYLAALLCVVVYTMVWGIWARADGWRSLCATEWGCARFVRPAWPRAVSSLGMDFADDQWREYRSNLPILCALMLGHAALSRAVRAVAADTSSATVGSLRTGLNLTVSMIFIFVMHGLHALFPLALASGSYILGKALAGTPLCVPVTWVYGLSLLWVKEYTYRGFVFGSVFGSVGDALDGRHLRGMHPWHLTLNLLVLRLISFNLDLHWAVKAAKGDAPPAVTLHKHGVTVTTAADKKHDDDPVIVTGSTAAAAAAAVVDVPSERGRVRTPHPLDSYNLHTCIAYCFYTPLYLAGPILSYNAFVSYMRSPAVPSRGYLLQYTVRLLLAVVLLESVLRVAPTFALARSGLFRQLTPGSLAVFGYAVLNAMWLKFLVSHARTSIRRSVHCHYRFKAKYCAEFVGAFNSMHHVLQQQHAEHC